MHASTRMQRGAHASTTSRQTPAWRPSSLLLCPVVPRTQQQQQQQQPQPQQQQQHARGAAQACRAHPRRVAKVTSAIQREISEMFISDSVVQDAICPERRTGLDDALSAIAGVTHVYVSNDLQVVKAYVSVYSDEKGKRRALANLRKIAPYVRHQIGQRVRLRLTPEIRFEYDDEIEQMEKVVNAIGAADFARYAAEAEAEAAGLPYIGAGGGGGEDGDEDEEDEDGGGGGFFDGLDEEAGAAASGGGWVEEGEEFEDEEDEMEYVEEPASAALTRPGPFDFMFDADDEDEEDDDICRDAAPRTPRRGSAGAKAAAAKAAAAQRPRRR